MEEKIIEIMKSALNTADITPESTQGNCEQWDSLHHLNLVVELEEEFDVEFEPEEIAEMKTFEVVKRILEDKLK